MPGRSPGRPGVLDGAEHHSSGTWLPRPTSAIRAWDSSPSCPGSRTERSTRASERGACPDRRLGPADCASRARSASSRGLARLAPRTRGGGLEQGSRLTESRASVRAPTRPATRVACRRTRRAPRAVVLTAPSEVPSGRSVSQAIALRTARAEASAPGPDRSEPGGRPNRSLEGVNFPDWSVGKVWVARDRST